jgi:hypothetical protein
LVLAAVALTACTADLGTVRFQMPARVFRFGTSGSLWATAPATLPEASCAADLECCPVLSPVAIDCGRIKPRCEQGRCGMVVVLERTQPVWLMREVPDLGLVDRSALGRLEITSVRVRGEETRADAPSGEVGLYFGPYETVSSSDKRARPVAFVASVRVGGEDSREAEISAEAAPALRAIAADPTDPFSMIAVARLSVGPRGEVPRGDYVMVLDIELATSLGI